MIRALRVNPARKFIGNSECIKRDQWLENYNSQCEQEEPTVDLYRDAIVYMIKDLNIRSPFEIIYLTVFIIERLFLLNIVF